MSELVEIHNVEDASALLPNAHGYLVFSAEGCKPCELMWDVLRRPEFGGTTRTKILLSIHKREDCKFFRDNKIAKFPTVAVFENGKELKRFSGLMQDDDVGAVASWVADRLAI